MLARPALGGSLGMSELAKPLFRRNILFTCYSSLSIFLHLSLSPPLSLSLPHLSLSPPPRTAQTVLHVSVENINDNPPQFNETQLTLAIDEEQAAGGAVHHCPLHMSSNVYCHSLFFRCGKNIFVRRKHTKIFYTNIILQRKFLQQIIRTLRTYSRHSAWHHMRVTIERVAVCLSSLVAISSTQCDFLR